MQALCPHCLGSPLPVPCEFCDGTGAVAAVLPAADPKFVLWNKVCGKCGAMCGGCFSGPGLPDPEVGKYSCCPGCNSGSENIRLEKADGP